MNDITILEGGLSVDDRGTVSFVNDFDFWNVKRFYQVENHKSGFVRAWHGHKKEGKYVYVANGSILLGIVDMKTGSVSKFILSSKKPRIIFIPPNNYNGFKTLEENTRVIFFSTSTLEESLGDDIRMDFDTWNIWGEDFR